MPDEIKYAPNATPPAFTNNADWTIEPGTHVRIKLIGTRTEVGRMFAVGNINGDYLGYALLPLLILVAKLSANCLFRCLQDS
jgi:DNA-directed RNA polymerase II subunit RPB7